MSPPERGMYSQEQRDRWQRDREGIPAKRVLVTGCAGHIGSALLRDWPAVDLVGLDNLASQRLASLFRLPQRVPFLEADILDANFDRILSKHDIDLVVHLAGLIDAEASVKDPALWRQVNFSGAARVFEACCGAGVPVIFPSTTSIYGAADAVVDEESLSNPQSPYARSKYDAESQFALWQSSLPSRLWGASGSSMTLQGICFRFGTIYGMSPGWRNQTVVNKFCWQAAHGQPLTVWTGALDQKRPYLALSDAIGAIKWAATRLLDQKQTQHDDWLYNVVSGNHTVREVVDTIREFVPDVKIKEVDSPILNQLSYEVSGARLTAAGFTPVGTLRAGIRETLQALRPDLF